MNSDTKPRAAVGMRSLSFAFASLGVAFNCVFAADGQSKDDAKLRTIEIRASDVKWEVAGKPVTEIVVRPGDKLIWMNTGGDHGISFSSKDEPEAVLEFERGGNLPILGEQTIDGKKVWGTPVSNVAANGQPKELARATVKAGCSKLSFLCTQHGDKMQAKKAIKYFGETQGWTPEEVRAQVLTPLEERSLLGTVDPDPCSIMC